MITSISWVPKGVTKVVQVEAEPPSKEELEEILKAAVTLETSGGIEDQEYEDMDADDAKKTDEVSLALAAVSALGKASENRNSGTKDIVDGMTELQMDKYDDEEVGVQLYTLGSGDTYYKHNGLDPRLKDEDDDDEDEIEDLAIKPSDAVILCASSKHYVDELQVCILEELDNGVYNLFLHHDIILPAQPFCTEWLNCNLKGGDKGNFVAVGSKEPSITIWDLDIVDELEPFLVLGGTVKKKKGEKKSVEYKKDSHRNSVLGLSWNKKFKKYLASASADKSIKIWDLVTGECLHTREHHKKEVQAVAWNPHVPDVLLSGSFDRSVVLIDMRYPSHTGTKSELPADVESLAWDPHDPNSFLVSLYDGTIQGFDIRAALSDPTSGLKPCFTLHAHDNAVCTVSYSPALRKLLATGSEDKTVKLWDLSNNEPSCVATYNPKVGRVFSVSFSEDNPFLLAVGGTKGKLQVWDTSTDAEVARRFL